MSQLERAKAFKALHERPGIFVIPNPWDAGSAKMLALLGYEALATTSSGQAFTLGRADGETGREDAMKSIAQIVAATSLPVAGDLENGYGDTPEDCAETIMRAAQVGMVCGSIEDSTGNKENPIYSFEHSLERVKASIHAARSVGFPFTFTARAENYLHGKLDLKDTLRRLEAFAAAGADVLFAPGLKTREDIQVCVKAVAPKPVNVIMGLAGQTLTLKELEDLGVKRVSVGSSFARAAYGAFLRAAREVKDAGTFTYSKDTVPSPEINGMLRKK